MYKTDLHRQHVSVHKDPVRSRIPERPPVSGPGNKMGSAGRLAKNKSFAQFVHQSKIDNAFRCMCSSAQLAPPHSVELTHDALGRLFVIILAAQDPREALLQYAQRAQDNPEWVDVAYTATEPEKVLATKTLEEEEEAADQEELGGGAELPSGAT